MPVFRNQELLRAQFVPVMDIHVTRELACPGLVLEAAPARPCYRRARAARPL